MLRAVLEARRLARRLLLSGCVVYAVCASGCIIPTPLQEEPQAVPIGPALVAAECQPQFGPFSSPAGVPGYEIDLVATDGNLTVRQLFARFFRGTDQMSGHTRYQAVVPLQVTLTPNYQQQPEKYFGSFLGVDLCASGWFQNGDLVYVIVSDAGFGASGQPLGLTDQNYWVLTCP
jgi:hypothetical protein